MRNLEYLGEKTGNYHSIVKLFEHLKRDKKKQTFWNYLVDGHVILIENDQIHNVCVFFHRFLC